jgi:hypothetical protein
MSRKTKVAKLYRNTAISFGDDIGENLENLTLGDPREKSSAKLSTESMLRKEEKKGKQHPWDPMEKTSAAVSQHTGPVSAVTSPTQGLTDPIMTLEYDSFIGLVNGAVNKPRIPEILYSQLPEDLQADMELNEKGQGEFSTWTCTPSIHIPSEQIPLRVDDHPVVLPVEYKYPLTGMLSPPPDPHPLFISPQASLSDQDVHHIFSTFPTCLGFYLLVNGFLQVIMPDEFDYEQGLQSLPCEFGGLKVSLVPETVCPTAGELSVSSPTTTTTSTRTAFERIFGQSAPQTDVAGPARTEGPLANAPANAVGVSVGCTVRAVVSGSKSKQRFEGKTGVAISPLDDNSKKFITIPTHLLTDAVLASKTTNLDSDTWRTDVKVCVASNSVEVSQLSDPPPPQKKSLSGRWQVSCILEM